MNRSKNTILHGITVSLTKRRIQKCQRQLGNGHDTELYLTLAELYKHLEKRQLTLEAYKSAAESLLKSGTPLDTSISSQLISVYKSILSLSPFDGETASKLSREYQRRGMDYRAASLHISLAERYTRRGDYRKAIEQYQRVFEIEPGSIAARQTCAELYYRIGENKSGAREYMQIGDIFFEHQKFDGALAYYQKASELHSENKEIKQKILMTQQILDGTIIPQAQASLQKLYNMNQDTSHLKRSLAEKERIEKELRHNIHQLKQRYQQSVTFKNQQLQATQKRLDELSTYVAVLKDNLEQIESEKQGLREQVEQEVVHKKDLEGKLAKLSTLRVSDYHVQNNNNSQSAHLKRLESSVTRLRQGKTKLEEQLQVKLEQSSKRETQLRDHLAARTSKGETLQQQLITMTQERRQVEQKLHQQLQESLDREQGLRKQIKKLIQQHEHALERMEDEKRAYEKKYKATQTRINIVEKHNMTTLKQLHDELSKQCEMESSFSKEFHKSLQEITTLLHTQEQEIQKLERL